MKAFLAWLRCLFGVRCDLPPEDQRFVQALRKQERAARASADRSRRRAYWATHRLSATGSPPTDMLRGEWPERPRGKEQQP